MIKQSEDNDESGLTEKDIERLKDIKRNQQKDSPVYNTSPKELDNIRDSVIDYLKKTKRPIVTFNELCENIDYDNKRVIGKAITRDANIETYGPSGKKKIVNHFVDQ